jgi:hypothetical protein
MSTPLLGWSGSRSDLPRKSGVVPEYPSHRKILDSSSIWEQTVQHDQTEDATHKPLHLGHKAAPGRLRAFGFCRLFSRQLAAQVFDGNTQFHKHMVCKRRVFITDRQGIKTLR